MRFTPVLMAASAVIGLGLTASAQQSGTGPAAMTFFVTSANPGQGANLGGLEGADRHCQALAQAAGAGGRNWRAYLSTMATGGQPAVNARDRIGRGPWQNTAGTVIARSVDDLHSDANNLNKQTALTERGAVVNGRGDTPNIHDILTGSQADGRAFPAGQDMTCGNWTLGGEDGSAMLGHHDRTGTGDPATTMSWNAAHASDGCSMPRLRRTGGAGLLYCFAAD
ncbi:hypothetical protein [Neoroseomonas soli]|uniref:Lectin n=1 Tax=Neoroseomonas soli TaxID=1081025 RepID=A0A9X9X1Z8_9PROT|nr:hypothetical protein [Neoroseomonas soli]MBR0673427.1 hypothetical protein [Neoroseomonas soli]